MPNLIKITLLALGLWLMLHLCQKILCMQSQDSPYYLSQCKYNNSLYEVEQRKMVLFWNGLCLKALVPVSQRLWHSGRVLALSSQGQVLESWPLLARQGAGPRSLALTLPPLLKHSIMRIHRMKRAKWIYETKSFKNKHQTCNKLRNFTESLVRGIQLTAGQNLIVVGEESFSTLS
jgi:hypothetical protein